MINVQGENFLKINTRADQSKTAAGGNLSSKLLNLHAPLFGIDKTFSFKWSFITFGLVRQKNHGGTPEFMHHHYLLL